MKRALQIIMGYVLFNLALVLEAVFDTIFSSQKRR